jgi:aspartate/methionine/tyrosine aminotransferase
MRTAKRLEGVGEYYFSRKLREIEQLNLDGQSVINLGIGSPDLPPHPEVIRVLQEESLKPNQHAYQSYKGSAVLRKAISDWYQQWYRVALNPQTEILPLLGSKEGIMHICMTYINPGDLVLIPNPGYPTYASAATIAGATVLPYDLTEANNWMPDFAQLRIQIERYRNAQADGAYHRILTFLNYPHMPTGQLPSKTLFEKWIAFAREMELLLVHDNPYSFILNDQPLSILEVTGAKEVAVELNSLSKSHNMAGWRIGFLAGSQQRIDEVLRFKSNMDSGMFLPLQLAAAKALELEKEWHDEVNAIYRTRREKVYELLNCLKCTYNPNQAGMFVWAKISEQYDNGYTLSDAVLSKSRVFITPGGIFGTNGSQYIRVSLCSDVSTFEQALERIKAHF